MSWFKVDEPHQLLAAPDVLFKIGNFPVTNSVVMVLLNVFLVLLFVLWVRSFKVRNPGKGQLAVEEIIKFLENFFANIVGIPKLAKEIVPITTALTLYLLLNNLLPILLPFISAITVNDINGHAVPLFRIATSDLNTTLSLSLGMFIVGVTYAFKKVGFFGHVTKFIQIPQLIKESKKGVGGFLNGLVMFAVGLLEIISELARILSLCLRLFGNIFAGELLLTVVLGAFAIGLPAFVLLFGVLVGCIQAIVFGSLVSANMTSYAQKHH